MHMIVKCKLGLACFTLPAYVPPMNRRAKKTVISSAIPAKQSTKENVALEIQARGILIDHP